jgi:hypothetical protein
MAMDEEIQAIEKNTNGSSLHFLNEILSLELNGCTKQVQAK